MQITVTDHNDWEGESFSFVLEVDEKLAEKIKSQEMRLMQVELGTTHTAIDIDNINSISDNGYMDRIGLYEIKPHIIIVNGIDFYDTLFYKGCGLNKITNSQ